MTDRKRRVASAHTRVRLRLASDERLVSCVRRGEPTAFEALYDRHAAELLSFCRYLLSSRADAEDALQATFASAYRALNADERPVALRPWLFAIARNQCLTILRRRRPTVELNGEPARRGDPFSEVQLREEVRDTLGRLSELPERQRAAMVLSELRGFSQAEIGTVLGVRAEQVKALVYQARADLISERRARETNCDEIREELSSARGAALLRGRLRRHVRSCEDCRLFADGVARQRRHVAGLLPLAPWLVLKLRGLQDALAGTLSEPTALAGGATLGGTVAGAALEIAGGSMKAIAVKTLAGAALLGLGGGIAGGAGPHQPLTRLAHDVAGIYTTHTGHSGAGASNQSGARAGRNLLAGGGTGLGGAGGRGAVTERLGTGGGERGTVERQPNERGPGGGSVRGGAHDATRAANQHKRTPAGHTTGGEREETRATKLEQRQQLRSAHVQQREAHQQQREEAQPHREERKQAAEERRGSTQEHQRVAEERDHESEGRVHERQKSKRQAERQHAAVQRQHEHLKTKHEREHEQAGEERLHQRERTKRERLHRRAREARERARGVDGPLPAESEEAAE